MVHLLRRHNMAIATPPYLKLLLTSHLVVIDAVQELWMLDEVCMECLDVIHKLLAEHEADELILVKVAFGSLF